MKRNLLTLLLLAVMLFSACLLCISCGGGGDDDDGDEPTNKRELLFDGENYTIFGKTANNNFDVIYAVGETSTMAEVAVGLCNKMADAGFPKPRNSADTDKDESTLEFLIGDTNRALSAEAKAIVEANADPDTNDMHWVWLYKDGQLALYANSLEAYNTALLELDEKYFKDGVYKVKKGLEEIGYVEGPHEAYMEYEIPDNFFEGYEDPFGMKASDYKQMVITHINEKTYQITYFDERGGAFTSNLVQKKWGVWMMGAMQYSEKNGKIHVMTAGTTDYEMGLKINGKGNTGWKSGNHGNYPSDKLHQAYIDSLTGEIDPSVYYNDRMLDITFYDAKTGEKLDIARIGNSATANGIRIVEHHNVYEFNYAKENILLNVERSYLYNGYDVMCDSRLYATQELKYAPYIYSTMLPIFKEYGNCFMFYQEDGSTVYMKTPVINSVNGNQYGVDSTKIDVWGENNPKYHFIVTMNDPEERYNGTSTITPDVGMRNMDGGVMNKLYCATFSDSGRLAWGDELHFNSIYSFSIQDDFVNPDREPDYWVGRQ